MTEAGRKWLSRSLLIRGGSAAVAVATVLIVWLVSSDEPNETVAAGVGREAPETGQQTIITEPGLEGAVTTSPGATTTSPTAARAEPAKSCAADAVVVTTEADRSSYPQGATVRIHSTARNVSDGPCRIGGVTDMVIADSEGNTVLLLSVSDLQAEGSAGGGTPPGESLSWATEIRNQQGGSRDGSEKFDQLPPGQYSVTVVWGSGARGSGSFEVQG